MSKQGDLLSKMNTQSLRDIFKHEETFDRNQLIEELKTKVQALRELDDPYDSAREEFVHQFAISEVLAILEQVKKV